MTKIKLCGLTRMEDIEAVNILDVEYIGFVFAKTSKRYISPMEAALLKKALKSPTKAVGVFVDEEIGIIVEMVQKGIIDVVQLHGKEDEEYIKKLQSKIAVPVIKAFTVAKLASMDEVEKSPADYVLVDAGAGTGTTFDWSLVEGIKRPYFLAGGLDAENVALAIEKLAPYGVDVSSGIERDGRKDEEQMARFVGAVRKDR